MTYKAVALPTLDHNDAYDSIEGGETITELVALERLKVFLDELNKSGVSIVHILDLTVQKETDWPFKTIFSEKIRVAIVKERE